MIRRRKTKYRKESHKRFEQVCFWFQSLKFCFFAEPNLDVKSKKLWHKQWCHYICLIKYSLDCCFLWWNQLFCSWNLICLQKHSQTINQKHSNIIIFISSQKALFYRGHTFTVIAEIGTFLGLSVQVVILVDLGFEA